MSKYIYICGTNPRNNNDFWLNFVDKRRQLRPKTVKLNKILSIVLFLVRSIVLSKIWSKSVCGWERWNDDGTTKACQEKDKEMLICLFSVFMAHIHKFSYLFTWLNSFWLFKCLLIWTSSRYVISKNVNFKLSSCGNRPTIAHFINPEYIFWQILTKKI